MLLQGLDFFVQVEEKGSRVDRTHVTCIKGSILLAEGFEDKHKDGTLKRRNSVSLFLAVNFQGHS